MLRKNCIFPDQAARSSSVSPVAARSHAAPLFDAIEFLCDADKTIVTPCVPSPRARVFNGAISWPFRGPFNVSNLAVITCYSNNVSCQLQEWGCVRHNIDPLLSAPLLESIYLLLLGCIGLLRCFRWAESNEWIWKKKQEENIQMPIKIIVLFLFLLLAHGAHSSALILCAPIASGREYRLPANQITKC